MTTSIDQLVGEFADAWKAGRRPDVATYLERAEPDERAELATLLEVWLDVAPTPDFDDATRARIAAEPALVAARETAAALELPLAERIVPLRERAGLAVADVARRLAERLGFDDTERAAVYLDRLERDELDERRLSRRLIDALAGILGADAALLAPRPAAAPLFRAQEPAETWLAGEIDALSRAAFRPAPAEPADDLDRLFLGGPEG